MFIKYLFNWDLNHIIYRFFIISWSPILTGLPVTIDAAIENKRIVLLCGASQYSALAGMNFSNTSLGESGPSGNHGFANIVHKR